MPYFVQPVVFPSVTIAPNQGPSPQLQQFANGLANELNQMEQRGFHLEEVVEIGTAALIIFKQ